MSELRDSVTLLYNDSDGIVHASDLQYLPTPGKNIEAALDICEDITKVAKKNKIVLWLCLLMPVGLIVAVLSGLLLSSPAMFVGIVVGLLMVLSFPLIVVVSKSRKEKNLNSLFRKFGEKTDGQLSATPNYETRTQATKSGLRTFRSLASITVKVTNPVYKSNDPPARQSGRNTALPYNSHATRYSQNPYGVQPPNQNPSNMHFNQMNQQSFDPNLPPQSNGSFNPNGFDDNPGGANLNVPGNGGSHYPEQPPGFSQYPGNSNFNVDGHGGQGGNQGHYGQVQGQRF